MTANKLSERAILVRVSLSMPGCQRQDPQLSKQVKSEHGIANDGGDWVKKLYPTEALKTVKQKHSEIRDYFFNPTFGVTFPFDTSTGILPASMIESTFEKVRDMRDKLDAEIEKFLDGAEKWVRWAVKAHNGTFNPDYYPGCYTGDPADWPATAVRITDRVAIDPAEFKTEMRKRFAFDTEPLPVPASDHFSTTVASLLGVDTKTVDLRVAQTAIDAQRDLLRRMMTPVQAMIKKLKEDPKPGREDIIFRDSLIGNLREIAALAPKMNLAGDPQLDQFAKEIEELAKPDPETLRNKDNRTDTQRKAEELARKMAAYNF